MNYLILLIIIFVLLVASNNYILNNDKKIYSLNGDIKPINEDFGFIKPEHRLLNIFTNIILWDILIWCLVVAGDYI